MPKLVIALTQQETDDYLRTQRVLRLATVDGDGQPQVVPLWFVWVDGTVFMNTTVGNLTVDNLDADPRAAGTVDDGETYGDLRGVVLRGRVERAGDDPRLDHVKDVWSQKYLGGNLVPFDRWANRVWLRLTPERLSSWDFRKIAEARAKRAAEAGA